MPYEFKMRPIPGDSDSLNMGATCGVCRFFMDTSCQHPLPHTIDECSVWACVCQGFVVGNYGNELKGRKNEN